MQTLLPPDALVHFHHCVACLHSDQVYSNLQSSQFSIPIQSVFFLYSPQNKSPIQSLSCAGATKHVCANLGADSTGAKMCASLTPPDPYAHQNRFALDSTGHGRKWPQGILVWRWGDFWVEDWAQEGHGIIGNNTIQILTPAKAS